MSMNVGALAGFLTLFVLYQIAEANGLDMLHIPRKPLSTFLLFIGVIVAAAVVAYAQGANGLAAYGLGADGWRYYPLGVLLGVAVQGVMEGLGLALGIRKVSDFRLSLPRLAGGFLFILLANFPAAAEDLITRGYPFRYMQQTPLVAFMVFSSFLYVINHILRLATKPITDWYHLPFTGLTLAYALAQTHSLWFVIGLHQSGNVIYYLMRQLMNVENTADVRRRIAYGIASELVFLAVVMLVVH